MYLLRETFSALQVGSDGGGINKATVPCTSLSVALMIMEIWKELVG